MRSVVFCVAFAGVLPLASPSSALEDPASAASACARHRNTIALIEDRTVLCLDGPIIPGRTAVFDDLKSGGTFVVRSIGGFAPEAITVGNILRDKNATVVVYDYCLSACANYLLVASSRAYVLKDAIVAWHGGPFACSLQGHDRMHKYLVDNIDLIRADFRRRYPDVPQWAISPDLLCAASDMSKQFYRERDLDDRHVYAPQTPHTKKFVDTAVKQSTGKKSLFWMWHPHNYGGYFKSRVVYESYPGSQREVDELLVRARLPDRVVYDPPRDP